jgi:hypothetical protein
VKRYVVLLAFAPGDGETASERVRDEHSVAHRAFEEFVDEHGRRISSAPLAGPDTATTIRRIDGAVQVTDGPFAESVEQIGGYYDVELPDLDAAIEAGRLLPASYTVEIRPTVPLAGDEAW